MRLGDKLSGYLGGASARSLDDHLGLHTVDDLLRHYPRRYDRRGQLTDLGRLSIDEHVTIMARVRTVTTRAYRRPGRTGRPDGRDVRTEVVVTDGTGQLLLTFFRQPWRARELRPGTLGLFAGRVGAFRGRRQLLHPECEVLGDDEVGGELLARPLIPIYPAAARVASWQIDRCIGLVLDQLDELDDPLPAALRERHGFADLRVTLEHVHRPRTTADWQRARDRLRYDEAVLTQVVLARRRASIDASPARPRPPTADGVRARLETQLPFTLTAGQRAVGEEIRADLSRSHPMHRLLQGEVGSGKTVVALLAMLQVVDAGGQAVLLAPTEVLAQQHQRTLSALLGTLGLGGMLGGSEVATRVRMLTGSSGAAARREAMLEAASGLAGIVVGTHALLEERVRFAELGLVVVDEQHRFGVQQRAVLTERAGDHHRPHVLVMTATPIPRTVAMTVFGDLETSVLAEVPAGRLPVQTTVVPAVERPDWLARAWDRVREECRQGRQAYVVCPRIGADVAGEEPEPPTGDEALPATHAVVDVAAELGAGPLNGLRIEVLHGRLPPDAKDGVMDRFAAAEIDVLVATTVIEVGVDVANATVMVVMDADRFGLSQLHQLRGRVGRGTAPGLCLLVTETTGHSAAHDRLEALAATTDGFVVSLLDVKVRREGDVLGASQSGRRSSLRLLSVVDHEDVIADARADATALVAADRELAASPALAAAVVALEESAHADFLAKK